MNFRVVLVSYPDLTVFTNREGSSTIEEDTIERKWRGVLKDGKR